MLQSDPLPTPTPDPTLDNQRVVPFPKERQERKTGASRHIALRFVILIGVLSLFADCTYEGARSVLGPYLALLGASATIIGIVTGFGELLGYGLRFFSGRAADATGRFWPVCIAGYVVQMVSVPALALVNDWHTAAALIVLERVGKAIRNPPRDVMLAHAAKHLGGYGWAFGLHEAFDQVGALIGPLVVAGALAWRHSYQLAFAALFVPAVLNLSVLATARRLYPQPRDLEAPSRKSAANGFPRVYWVYLAGAALVAAGFADYPLIAYHFNRTGVVPGSWIALYYAIAMSVSGGGSAVFGRLFDRYQFRVLIALTAVSALFAPLVFFGNEALALVGVALWGLGMGVHEALIPAAVAPMVAEERRGRAFGLFTAGYGAAWFAGSAVIGLLYDRSSSAAALFCLVLQCAAVPIFAWVSRHSVPADAIN